MMNVCMDEIGFAVPVGMNWREKIPLVTWDFLRACRALGPSERGLFQLREKQS